MLHSGCVKLHQKFRDFVGLPMGLLREESPENRMNTGLFGSRSGEIRLEGCPPRSAVQQALIISSICEPFRTLHSFFARLCAENRKCLKPWNVANRLGAC